MTGRAPVIFMFADRRETMKSILEQFYYGNITPCETTVTDNRFQKIVSDIDSIESEMLEQCPEIRKLLDQYRDKNGRWREQRSRMLSAKASRSVCCS